MSDLFLTSAGLELGDNTDTDVDNNPKVLVFVENVTGELIKLKTGEELIVRFITDNVHDAFCLVNKQIAQAVVKYGSETCIITFGSYNYTIEKSLGKAIITIESSHAKK